MTGPVCLPSRPNHPLPSLYSLLGESSSGPPRPSNVTQASRKTEHSFAIHFQRDNSQSSWLLNNGLHFPDCYARELL